MKKELLFTILALCCITLMGQVTQRSTVAISTEPQSQFYPTEAMVTPLQNPMQQWRQTPSLPAIQNLNQQAIPLIKRYSSDNFESLSYQYDEVGRVVLIRDSSDIIVKDTLEYDEAGNIIKLSGFQIINGMWKAVYYILYTYDEAGNMLTRTNFNSGGTSQWYQGGVYHYNYENGRKVSHRLYLGTSSDLYEFDTLFYDAAGNLVEEIYSNEDFFEGTFGPSIRFTYEYDNLQRLTKYNGYISDAGSWELYSYDLYQYDNYGNCIEHSTCNAAGNYTNRRFYEYDLSVPASEVYIPYDIPDQTYPEAFADQHKRVLERWHTRDENNVLQYVCDFIYVYEGETTALTDPTYTPLEVYPNPTRGIINLQGERAVEYELYDLQGKRLSQERLMGSPTLNLTHYPNGIYFLRLTLQDGRSYTTKVVKK